MDMDMDYSRLVLARLLHGRRSISYRVTATGYQQHDQRVTLDLVQLLYQAINSNELKAPAS